MKPPRVVVIDAEMARLHANTLGSLYDFNKRGLPVTGRFLEQVQDVIRSLRGLETEQELFERAWDGHEELSGLLFERYMAGLSPSGAPIKAPTTGR
jgi:hypothetical protein